jgi:hypothetical protein
MIGFISILVTSSFKHLNTTLSLIHTISSSPLYTHYDTPSSLVISWQRISSQKLSLQITMKSLVINHFVLLCPNLYSTSLENSLRTFSILVFVLSSATFHSFSLRLIGNCPELHLLVNSLLLEALCTDLTENTVSISDDVAALRSKYPIH